MKIKNKILLGLVASTASAFTPVFGLSSCACAPTAELEMSEQDIDANLEKASTYQYTFNWKRRNFVPKKIEILTSNVQSSEIDVIFGSIEVDQEATKQNDFEKVYVNATVIRTDSDVLDKDAILSFDIQFLIYADDEKYVTQSFKGITLHEFHNGFITKDGVDDLVTECSFSTQTLFFTQHADDKYRVTDKEGYNITVTNLNADGDNASIVFNPTEYDCGVNYLRIPLSLERKDKSRFWNSSYIAHYDVTIEANKDNKLIWRKKFSNLSLRYNNAFPENKSFEFQTEPGELYANCVVTPKEGLGMFPPHKFEVYPLNVSSPTGLSLDTTPVVGKFIDDQKKISFPLNIINPGRTIQQDESISFDLVFQNKDSNCLEYIPGCILKYQYKSIKLKSFPVQYVTSVEPISTFEFELAESIPEGATLSCVTQKEQTEFSERYEVESKDPVIYPSSKSVSVQVGFKRVEGALQMNDGVQFRFIFTCTAADGTVLWTDQILNVGISIPYVYTPNKLEEIEIGWGRYGWSLTTDETIKSTDIRKGQAIMFVIDTSFWRKEWPSNGFRMLIPKSTATTYQNFYDLNAQYIVRGNKTEGWKYLEESEYGSGSWVRINPSVIKQNDTVIIVAIAESDITKETKGYFTIG